MSEAKRTSNSILCMFLLLLVSLTPLAGAQSIVSAEILTEWVDDGTGNITHGYRIVLDQSLSFSELDEMSVTVSHTDVNDNEIGNWVLDWIGGNNTELSFVVNSTLNWNCLLYTSDAADE